MVRALEVELPRDALANVFSFLGARDIAACGAVSRDWRAAAHDAIAWGPLCRFELRQGNFAMHVLHERDEVPIGRELYVRAVREQRRRAREREEKRQEVIRRNQENHPRPMMYAGVGGANGESRAERRRRQLMYFDIVAGVPRGRHRHGVVLGAMVFLAVWLAILLVNVIADGLEFPLVTASAVAHLLYVLLYVAYYLTIGMFGEATNNEIRHTSWADPRHAPGDHASTWRFGLFALMPASVTMMMLQHAEYWLAIVASSFTIVEFAVTAAYMRWAVLHFNERLRAMPPGRRSARRFHEQVAVV
eukprot:TRINITY_DN66181_c4_g2_i1.p1 TRINITY_DN66181_c4_g2~~TRINITY_DN66181_c4_g2_i1.p1  ORF type:complete len:323 (-),score=77.29 TRINITY_DN66181_c4_g2_i1:150-1061(-)